MDSHWAKNNTFKPLPINPVAKLYPVVCSENVIIPNRAGNKNYETAINSFIQIINRNRFLAACTISKDDCFIGTNSGTCCVRKWKCVCFGNRSSICHKINLSRIANVLGGCFPGIFEKYPEVDRFWNSSIGLTFHFIIGHPRSFIKLPISLFGFQFAFHSFAFTIENVQFPFVYKAIISKANNSENLKDESPNFNPVWLRLMGIISIIAGGWGWWNITWRPRYCDFSLHHLIAGIVAFCFGLTLILAFWILGL